MDSNIIAPLATPLPAGPSDDLYTPAQWATFLSILDTIIPSIQRGDSDITDDKSCLSIPAEQYDSTISYVKDAGAGPFDKDALDAYFREKPSELPESVDYLKRLVGFYIPAKGQKGLGFILSALK